MIDGKPAQLGSMLIDLDCVLDTVQGTLAAISPTLFAKNAAGNYFSRTKDEFEGITPEQFKTAYAKRGAVELMLSSVTPAASLITDFVRKINSLGAHGPSMLVPNVDINFYPFNAPQHVRDNIVNAIKATVGERFNCQAVFINPKDITFDYVRVKYDHLVMYDSGPFLEAQVKDGKLERGIPNVTLMGPILNRTDEDVSQEELYDRAIQASNDFAPLFNWILLPVELFCTAMNPHKIRPQKTPPPEPEGPSEEVTESNLDGDAKPDDWDDDVFGLG